MGRKHDTLEAYCRGSHWTWDQRLMLQNYLKGTGKCRKEKCISVLAKMFHKSRHTIAKNLGYSDIGITQM